MKRNDHLLCRLTLKPLKKWISKALIRLVNM